MNVQPRDDADHTPTGATDTPTDDLDSTEPGEQNQAAEAATPEAERESQEARPEVSDATDPEPTQDPEPTEDRDSPDTQTEDRDSSPVHSDEGEDFSSAVWGRTTYNPHRFDAVYDQGSGRIIAPWLVPWKDGFLQVGHPLTDDGYRDRSRFVFRFSADGLEWTDFDALDVPREHDYPTPYVYPAPYVPNIHVVSNGEHLVVAVPWPPLDGTWPGHDGDDAINGPKPHARAYVSVTSDLRDWDTREILVSPPDFLHPSLQTDLDIIDLDGTQGGWLLEAVTSAYIDLPSLLPDEIRRSASRIRPTDYDGEGVTFEWTPTEDHESAGAGTRTGRFSWEELGTTPDLYEEYGIDGLLRNKPYVQPPQMYGSVWVAAWGEDPVRAELPSVGGWCCYIAPTGDGYIGLSDHSAGGYAPWRFGPASLVFSPDGLSWDIIGPIAGEEVWLYAIGSVNGGAIIHGSKNTDYSNETRLHLLGESDGSEFYEIDQAGGASLVQCLMMHGKAPVGWPGTAVNGDTLLTFGEGGLIERYATPAPSGDVDSPNTCAVDTEFRTSLILGQGYGELWIDHYSYDSFLRNKVGPAVLPWRDGFLEFGHPKDPRLWSVDRTSLIMRVSADGLDWTSPEPFRVPFASLLVDDASRRPSPIHDVTSDGLRLVWALQQGDSIHVSITDDLVDWETVEIVMPPVEGVPDGETASARAEQVAVGPDGWLLRTSTPEQTSGDVWSAAWGEEPSRAALPEVDGGTCCHVVGTSAGYVALAFLDGGGQPAPGDPEPVMFYSPDGSSWHAVDPPAGAGARLYSLVAVENGVVVTGPSINDQAGSGRDEPGTQVWLGDAAGSNWQPVELPLPPGRWSLSLWGDGPGAVGIGRELDTDYSYPYHVIGSADGVNWLVEPLHEAWEHRLAINGSLLVGVHHSGEIRHFVIP